MIPLERAPAEGIVTGYRWEPGDRVVAIGRTALRDILDFYYLAEDEGLVELAIQDRAQHVRNYRVHTDDLPILAESFAAMEFKTCAAQCVFCFIDQNPPGMRSNIYVKDEDYRFSFLYGNYITLTSLGKKGLQRIIDQRLSPLYVSVHATDVGTRTRLLGIKRKIDVMGILRHLIRHDIEIHTQIVLCPDFNDGEVLRQTLEDLGTLFPHVRSISVVPVGLTDHREGLAKLRKVDESDAERAVAQVEAFAESFRAERGSRLAYVSDEFYLQLSRCFPPLVEYEEMPQQDTGIGICRLMIEELKSELPSLRSATLPPTAMTVLTGTLAAQFFERDLRPLLDEISWLQLRVVPVLNRLYGAGITVAGLLSGRDFLGAIASLPPEAGTVLLPGSAVNHDGLFLDDLSVEELRERAGRPIEIADEGLVEILLRVAGRKP